MSNELHLINLHQIISEKGEDVESASLEIQENFLQKIGDDIFFMPPSYAKGYKFKYMLLNYLNLKAEIKARLEEEIITKWQSFYEPPKEMPAGTVGESTEVEKPDVLADKIRETDAAEAQGKTPDPAPVIIPPVQAAVSEHPKAEKSVASPDERQERKTPEPRIEPPVPAPKTSFADQAGMEKPVVKKKPIIKKAPVKKTVAKTVTAPKTRMKKAATPRSEPKKPASRRTVTPKQAVQKKPASVSSKKITGNRAKGARGLQALKKDIQDLTRDMTSLENRIEKMIKAFEGGPVRATAKARSVKKGSPPRAVNKKDAPTSDTERVIKLIARRKKNGMDVPTLSEKTGLTPQKIRGIITRALKDGKIKRIDRGLYVGS